MNMYNSFTQFIAIVGVAANALLILLILIRTPSYMRTFSQLLLFSAVADLMALLTLIVTLPREIAVGQLLVVQFHGICVAPSQIFCWFSFGVLQSTFPISCALLSASFGLRFAAVANYRVHRCAVFVIIFAVAGLFLPYIWMFQNIFRVGISNSNNIDIVTRYAVEKTQMSIIDQNERFTKITIHLALATALILFLLSLIFRSLILRKLKTVHHKLSPSSRQAHFMLIRALNLQLPISSLYFSAAIIFLLNSRGIIRGEYVEYWSVLIANLQNVFMPVANLWIIHPYRKSLMSFLSPGTNIKRISSPSKVPPNKTYRMQ